MTKHVAESACGSLQRVNFDLHFKISLWRSSVCAGQCSDDQRIAWQAQGGLAWRQPGRELVPDLSTGTKDKWKRKRERVSRKHWNICSLALWKVQI